MFQGYRCFCGQRYYCNPGTEMRANGGCTAGQACPRLELGQGDWHVALPKLNDMKASEVTQRYPGLRLVELQQHVAFEVSQIAAQSARRDDWEQEANRNQDTKKSFQHKREEHKQLMQQEREELTAMQQERDAARGSGSEATVGWMLQRQRERDAAPYGHLLRSEDQPPARTPRPPPYPPNVQPPSSQASQDEWKVIRPWHQKTRGSDAVGKATARVLGPRMRPGAASYATADRAVVTPPADSTDDDRDDAWGERGHDEGKAASSGAQQQE
jgi:hypothetical protein